MPRNPHEFLGKGDVMFHRPCLVAWPALSIWATWRPNRTDHLDNRSSRTR